MTSEAAHNNSNGLTCLFRPWVDLVSAYATIGDVVTHLNKTREGALTSFQDIFKKAEGLLQEIGSSHDTIPVSRVCKRQTQRANLPFQTAEKYYRRSVCVPFLDHVLTELQTRFGNDTIPVGFKIKNLLSSADGDVAAVLEAAKVYEADIETLSLVKAEAERWYSTTMKFESIGDALAHAQTRMYPNPAKLLRVLITLPVSNAEAERSFLTLKRLKTYLRNTMGQDHLNGLALLGVHNEINIEIDSVINVFAQKNRRLMFV
ncbi:52 kDa repressor of the inhibitor of the protein kinase-like [Oratosquilla oratoria]|uniref:52 kDa repressor of the inhibitor of the protein kinase-like n=1 Tax=Oratosquilla oratoria TaxID=337810 RepID=UPI003F75B4E1